MRIAFYAPLKAPDHPVPSGERTMARLLIAALARGGHEVELASRLRSHLAAPDAARQAGIEAGAEAEADVIAARWATARSRPDAWFTYHAYFKAPDLLGPSLAQRFGLAYATAEASHAGKRAAGPWARWHRINEAALRVADLHFWMTPNDRDGLLTVPGRRGRLVELPPFIDAGDPLIRPVFDEAPRPQGKEGHQRHRTVLALLPHVEKVRAELADAGVQEARLFPSQSTIDLVTVAMMRRGAKLESYRLLALALALLPSDLPWRLTIVGDGPARDDVHAAFGSLPDGRVRFLGERSERGVADALGGADLYVWPGIDEAFGMAFLEAGAAGLPSLAMRCGGIPSVVRHGTTGVLTPQGDVNGFARALAVLIRDAGARRRMGDAAQDFVRRERTVEAASRILSTHLGALMPALARP